MTSVYNGQDLAGSPGTHTPTFMLSGVWAAPLASEDVEGHEPSPDILLGAYLLGHLETHTCESCGTHETPQWRKGWVSDVLGRSVLLCNACGIKYHKNQFCTYCREIYGKDVREGTEWVGCQSCEKLMHRKCEDYWQHGLNYQAPSADGAQHASTYTCPSCVLRAGSGCSPIGPSPPMSYQVKVRSNGSA